MINCQVDVFQRNIGYENYGVCFGHWVRLMNYFSFNEMMENCNWFKEEMEKKKKPVKKVKEKKVSSKSPAGKKKAVSTKKIKSKKLDTRTRSYVRHL